MATFQDYINALNSNSRRPVLRLELLRPDETVQSEISLELRLDGSLDINNKNGVRRSMRITLDNTTLKYIPDLFSNIWIGRKVKLYLGLNLDGEEYTFPSGTFVMEDPTVSDEGDVTINAVDKFALIDGSLGGSLDSIIIINAGTRLDVAVRAIMTISQDNQDPIIDTDIASLTLPYQIIHEEGSTLGSILEEIAFAYSAKVYYNENGVLVFERDIPDNTKGSIWKFNADKGEVNYISGSVTHKFSDVYNSVLVIGDNINGAIARGKVQNNDLLSQTSIPNIGFERLKVIHDNIINTSALAIERAKYELKRSTQLLTESPIQSIPLYHLDVDRVVELTDSRLGFEEKRSVINSLSIPFNNSSMSIKLVDSFEITL